MIVYYINTFVSVGKQYNWTKTRILTGEKYYLLPEQSRQRKFLMLQELPITAICACKLQRGFYVSVL